MSSVLAHTAPAEVEVAAHAIHVRAASVLFDAHLAVRALADITHKEETPQADMVRCSTRAFVVRLLAREAGSRIALIADQFRLVALSAQPIDAL